jgi:hypothetical protein
VCEEYELANVSLIDSAQYTYIDCSDNQTYIGVVPPDSTDYVCACTTPTQISGPTLNISVLGACLLPTTTLAPTTTVAPTTTLAPTTTTTLAPTTSTTTQAGIVTSDLTYFFNAVTGSFINQPGSWSEFSITKSFDYVFKDTVTGSNYFALFGINDLNKDTSSISFNGSDEWGWMDLSRMPNIGVSFTSQSVTLEAWINHQSGQPNLYSINQSFVMDYRFGGRIPFMDIGRDSGSYTTIEGTLNDGTDKDTIPGASITQDIFYHWAHTFDTSTNQHYLYRNGVLIGSGSASDEYNFGTPNFHIAEDYNSNIASTLAERRLQKIRIGNTRVYRKALSGAEVLQNYNTEKSLYGL